MRRALLVCLSLLSGCQLILGIQDPTLRATDDPIPDAAAPTPEPEPEPEPEPAPLDPASLLAFDGGTNGCAIKPDRTMWCWGASSAIIGHATVIGGFATAPIQIGTDADWERIAGGRRAVCGLRDGGRLFCWGDNLYGEVGSGTVGVPVTAPHEVDSAHRWRDVTVTLYQACAIRDDGSLWCWGSEGDLGLSPLPTRVGGDADWTTIRNSVEAICGLRGAGELYCLGWPAAFDDPDGEFVTVPTRVGDGLWRMISLEREGICGIRDDGSLWCRGFDNSGRFGTADLADRMEWAAVGDATDWIDVSLGPDHACGVRSGGYGYCWGRGRSGELGNGLQGEILVPTAVTSHSFTTLKTTGRTTCGRTADGLILCIGSKIFGALGDGETADVTIPTRIATDATAIAVGPKTTCWFTDTGTPCRGDNSQGGLGTSTTDPVHGVVWSNLGTGWTLLAAGCGLSIGRVGCWGDNRFGQLGNGTSGVPVPGVTWVLPAVNSVASVSVGAGVCAIMTADGSLWCWGADFPATPQLHAAGPWSSVSVRPLWAPRLYGTWYRSGSSLCAIRAPAPGALYCWGSGGSPSPTQVGADTDWTAVATGSDHTCGLRGGGLFCWGRGDFGQLGDGQLGAHSLPTRVGTDADWSKVAAARFLTCAIKTNKTLWCWGSSSHGQVGVYGNVAVPTQIGSDADWEEVAMEEHVCARKSDKTVWCWGNSDLGQVKSTTNRDTFLRIL